MFRKKSCENCGEKISGKENFCPNCGKELKSNSKKDDWGMLGKEDFEEFREEIRLPKGMNLLFNTLIKSLDKQFQELEKGAREKIDSPNIKKSGVSVNISISGNSPPKIKIDQFGNRLGKEKTFREIKGVQMKLSPEKMKKLSNLPKKEPQIKRKRISDSIIYELNIPGVKSIEDVSIVRLENSIEIKAIGNKYVYQKIIPINLPIINYDISNGKLILELKG